MKGDAKKAITIRISHASIELLDHLVKDLNKRSTIKFTKGDVVELLLKVASKKDWKKDLAGLNIFE